MRTAPSLALLALAACTVRIPDGAYACRDDDDCPPAFACVERLCYRASARPDAAPDEAPDAAPDDTCEPSTCDAGAPSEDACAEAGCDDGGRAGELCNGLDDDQNGLPDDGVSALTPLATLPAQHTPFRVRVFPADDGSVLLVDGELDPDTATTTIFATRLAPDGSVSAPRTLLASAGLYTFEAVVEGDTLGLLRATDEQGLVVTAFHARRLEPLMPDVRVVEGAESMPAYDLAITRDAAGSRLLVAYYEGETIALAGIRVGETDTANVDRFPLVDVTALESLYHSLQLAAAPCSQGIYVLLRRLTPDPMARLLGVNAAGKLTGLDLTIPLPEAEGSVLADARPLLQGGSCSGAPEALYAAYARFVADDPAAPDLSDPREPGRTFYDVLRVDLARALSEGTSATPSWRVQVESPRPIMPEELRTPPSHTLALAQAPAGALWIAGAVVDTDAITGDIAAFGLSADGARHAFAHGSVAPSLAGLLDLATDSVGRALVAGSWWFDGSPTQLFALDCE